MKKIQNNIQNIINQLNTSRFLPIILCFFIYIFCLALYVNTTSYGLSGNDDDTFINLNFEKYSVKDVFTQNILFNNDIKTYYRPLLALSFMIDNSISASPSIMHSTNIILYAVCAVLVFIFLKRYFFDTTVSFLAAAFFAAHPVNIFTVAWIPGRNDSLLCVFFLLSLIFFLEYLKNDKTVFLILNFIFFAAAVFIKENAVIIMPLCLMYWFIYKKRINKELFIITLIYSVIVSVFLVLYKNFANLWTTPKYIILLLDNIKVLFDYYSGVYLFNIHFSKYISSKFFVLGTVSFIISIFFTIFSGMSIKEKILYFFFPLFMLISTLFVGQIFFQGNRLYVPMIFMLIPFCRFLTNIFNKKIVYAILLFLILLCINMTFQKQKVFENELTYFGAIDREKPNYEIVMANLYSYNLLKYGHIEEAAVKAKTIAEITHYKNPYNLYVLSILSMYEENYLQAIEYLEHITNFDNDVYTKLAVCYDKIGNEREANYFYNVVLKLNEYNVEKTNEIIEREKQCFTKKSKISY